MTGQVAFTDGFDMYNGANAGTGLPVRWSIANSTYGVTGGRFGGQCMQMNGTSGGAGTIQTPGSQDIKAAAVFDGSGTTTALAIGFAFQLTSGRLDAVMDMQTAGGTQLFSWGVSATGQIIICTAAGGTVFTSAAGLVTAGTWYYAEIEATMNASTGTINFYLGGTNLCTLTGLNTGSGAGLVQMRVFGGGNVVRYVDDLYVVTGAATRLGECRVETLRPNSASVKAWTPDSGTTNYDRVNETQVDGNASYVQTSTLGARDLYGTAGLSSTPSAIFAVNVVAFPEKTDVTSRSLYSSVRSGVTDSDGTAQPLLASYSRLDRILTTDPATTATWTASGVNNLLFGPKAA